MIKIDLLNRDIVPRIIQLVHNTQLDYHEYRFLSKEQLIAYHYSSLIKLLENPNAFSCVATKDSMPLGLMNIIKDSFDSEMFGFDCYRLSLQAFTDDYEEIKLILRLLLNEIVKLAKKNSDKFYLSTTLNNNVYNSGKLFNSLAVNNFYYIHTLLVFTSNNFSENILTHCSNEIKIREVNIQDVEDVSALAQKSFRYSRFHLDPFLNKERSDILLKTSAENSILKKYADIMYVAEIKGKVVGYYSARKKRVSEFNKTIGEVIISAIDDNYRGMKLFSTLDNYILKWFSCNTDFAEMGTYLINYPVHKTWINKGLGLIRGVHQFSKFCE